MTLFRLLPSCAPIRLAMLPALCLFLIALASPACAAPAKPTVAKTLVNLPYAFSLEYNEAALAAICVTPPPAPNLGATLYPKTGGTLRVSAAYSVGETTLEEMQKLVKGCKKTARHGVFEAYYQCKDGLRAFVQMPVGGTGAMGLYQLHYATEGKKLNMPLFHSIYDSFSLLSFQRQQDNVPMESMYPGIEFIEDSAHKNGFRTEFANPLCANAAGL